MTTAITTAAQTARKAVGWAKCAADASKAARDPRRQGAEWAARRGGQSNAAGWHENADDWERVRSTAVDLATMWANIAGVLPLAEDRELA
ncbi:hypothetical protein ABZ235_26685 [Streptomyces canus]|uniref:hypothetical protein n=1 Tax=Streptomyces canus TaxID=58343 RepID=UPI0033B1E14F